MPRQAKPRWNKKRSRWYANVGDPDPGGRRREVYAPSSLGPRDEAGAWEWMRLEVARRAGPAAVRATKARSVKWLTETYLAWAKSRRDEGRISAEHFANKRYHLLVLVEAYGARDAASLGLEDMDRLVAALQARYRPNYVANICSTVSAAFNWAERFRHLDRNPVKGFKSPTVPDAPERFAERSEAAAFFSYWRTRTDRKSVAGRYDRLTLLLERILVRTGARPGELCNLWWDDIKWEGGRTSAGHAFAKAVIPPERWKAGVKTGKARTIYLSPVLTRALARERDRPGRHPVSVFVHGRGRGGKGADEPWESGSRLSKTVLRVRREAIAEGVRLRETGLPSRGLGRLRDEGHNRVTNYRWRHTAISTLLMMGVDAPTAAKLTGTSAEMVYKVYGHLLDSHLSAAAEKLAFRSPV